MQESKKFAFDVSITFFASVINLPLGLVITVILGRYLGAGELGLYRMTATIYGIAMLVAAIGIPAAMIKYVAEFKENRNKFNQIVSSGIITSLFLGIIFIALFYFLSSIFAGIFNMQGLVELLKILSPVFPFALVSSALLGLLNGIREMKKYGMATIIQSVLMVIVTVSLIYYGLGVAGAVIGVVLSSVGSCLFLILVTKNHFEITFSEYIPTTKRILKFGVQVYGATGMNMIKYQTDILLIGYFLTATDVGYYAVAVGLSRFLWIIPQSIQTITYPTASEYWAKNNHSALNKMIDKVMKYNACILLPIGLGAGFFAMDIVTLIFGEGFIYAVLPLQILLVGTVISSIVSRAIGASLSAVGRPDLSLKVASISAIVNIILNILLIPILGISGAAIATAFSLIIGAFIALALILKLLSIKIDIKWYAQITGITFTLIILFFIGMELINLYILGCSILITYTILILKFFLTKEDRSFFKSLIYPLISQR